MNNSYLVGTIRCTDAAGGEDVGCAFHRAPFSRKCTLLGEGSIELIVDAVGLSTVQDAGRARVTLVGESFRLLGLSCGRKWPWKLFVGPRERRPPMARLPRTFRPN